MFETELCGRIIAVARGMNARGINVNKSGNVSARVAHDGRDGFLITPTGVPYEALTPDDLVWLPIGAESEAERAGRLLPSSEWAMHEAVYRARPDRYGIVHTHSTYATALACQNLPIPAFHYMVATAGGTSIDLVPYETFGTKALARRAAEGLSKKDACLLEHHGVLALGTTVEKALTMAAEVENLAKQYAVVRSLGEPRLISEEEMVRVIERFATYGKQPAERSEDVGVEEGKA